MKSGAERKEFPLSHYWERGTTNLYAIAFVLLCGVVITAFLFSHNKPCAAFSEATLQTPPQTINLALANTPEKQSKGLGGCKYVPENSGMYFSFEQSNTHTFWMKDMLIPIDIIWIQGSSVVGIEKNVPNLPLDTPDEELPKYTSPVPVDAVLEVGAGMAEEYGIDENTVVSDTSPIL
ncbi:MAG: DUF192 domain-containing protein [bacterium]|nr:DUF192 domain-containing protein [bacterium]